MDLQSFIGIGIIVGFPLSVLANILGLVRSPYPGTPVTLAWLGIMTAFGVRSWLVAHDRSRTRGQRDWVAVADVMVGVMGALLFVAVIWTVLDPSIAPQLTK